MKIKIFAVTVLLCLLCGCAYKEPNDQYTVTALGFAGQGDKTVTYLQAIDAAGGEQNGSPKTFLVTGSGNSVNEALDGIRSQLSKKPSFGHCQLVLVSGDLAGEELTDVLTLCDELELSLRARLAFCGSIEPMLKNEIIADGSDLVALIKENSSSFGYGAHTALFEIKTAVLANNGRFALPVLSIEDDKIWIDGLCRYEYVRPKELLSVSDSIRYAKENDLYEGESSD